VGLHLCASDPECAQDAGHPTRRAPAMRDGVLVDGAVLPERPTARTLPCRLAQRVVAAGAPPPRVRAQAPARSPPPPRLSTTLRPRVAPRRVRISSPPGAPGSGMASARTHT